MTGMSTFRKWNPNPFANTVEDCAQRAIAAAPVDTAETIHYDSGTDFSQTIDGRDPDDIWPIMDEMMEAVHTLMPRLYGSVMRKLQE